MSVSNSLTKTKEQKTFSNFLMGDAIKRKINETVGGANGQRFVTSILSAVSTNPALQECEHSSIISAAFLGESLKLSPSPQLGQYYMVPFNDSKRNCKVAQFQLGYKGYIQLAIRSNKYKDIDVIEIREGEYKGRDRITGKHKFEFIEDEIERENKDIVGYMAYFEYVNGFTKHLYWTKEKMLNHADKYSKAFNKEAYKKLLEGNIPQKDLWKYSSFWYKDFDGMAYKTMLRQLISKWGAMSIEMQEAYIKDQAIIKENGDYEYIDSVEETIEPVQGQIIENEQTKDDVSKQEAKKRGQAAKVINDEEGQNSNEVEIEENQTNEEVDGDFNFFE